MRSRYSTLAAAVALALGSSAVGAAGVDDIFSIRGYGTLGGLYSSEDKADYVRDMYVQPEGAGYSEEVSYAVDSKTAIQLDMTFTDRFSAVVQLVSEGQYGNPWGDEPEELWHPTLEWANLSYRVTDNFTVRGGRIVLPFLMSAEYQKVGYANHWMRSPVEVYGKVSYSSVDGGDLMFKHDLGSGRNTIRAFGGQQKARRAEPLASWDADMFGFTDTYENGALTLRAAYLQAKVSQNTDDPAQMNQLRSISTFLNILNAPVAAARMAAMANVRDPNHKLDVKFYDVGATYDTGDWFVMAEVFMGRGSLMIPEHDSGYVSGGVRLNKWTPYATFARTDAKPFDAIPTYELASQTNPLTPLLIGAMENINTRSGSYSQDQDSVSVGVRWDVASNIAIKAQYDYVMLPDESTGMFVNRQPGFKAGTDVSLFGLSVDFLF